MTKPITDMSDESQRLYMEGLGRLIEEQLPPGPSRRGKALYVLVFTDQEDPGPGYFCSNISREGIVGMLRDLAGQLEERLKEDQQ